jgi:DNA-binding IclR family transcriptional regulator
MQSLERSIGILKALAAAGTAELRLSDVARAVRLSKPTTSRILSALCHQGFVEASREMRTFHLGPELVFLGWSAAQSFQLTRVARPVIERLAETTGDTAFLTVRSGSEAICADRVTGSYPVKALTMEVGNRRPLGIGSGSLALLAALPDEEIDEILKANADRLVHFKAVRPARIRREIQQARVRKYALAEGHVVKEVSGVGVAIRDPRGHPMAAVSVATISSRFENGRQTAVVRVTQAAAREIERALREANLHEHGRRQRGETEKAS